MRTLIVSALALVAIAFAGCSDFSYGRTLEGEVVNTGSRMKMGQESAQQKISLVVKATVSDSKMDEVAGGPTGVAIECLSTRCASLSPGTCHRFMCSYEYRWREPDVIACKHDKEIECSPAGG